MIQTKRRQSNLELLRIFCMFGVITVHTAFGILGHPDHAELVGQTGYCVTRTLIESLALCSVNTFVLISGWFGITFRWKSFCNLIFQVFFFLIGLSAIAVLMDLEPLSKDLLFRSLSLTPIYWFIKCYVGLYILAPVLNAFVQQIDQKTFRTVLVVFFVFQSIWGWAMMGTGYINYGYSAFSFIGLYLLARYVRLYRPSWSQFKAKTDLLIWLICSLFTTILLLVAIYLDNDSYVDRFMAYSSPLVIVSAMFLLLAFSKLSFQSKAINWIAKSCLAVYLMHHIVWTYWVRPAVERVAESDLRGVLFFLSITAILICFYALSVFCDKIRILVWEHTFAKCFQEKKNDIYQK